MSNRPEVDLMIPPLNGIDHVHVYVPDRAEAAAWYQRVLGFSPLQEFVVWAEHPGGPLTLSDLSGTVHIALFQVGEHGSSAFKPGTAIALAAPDAEAFLAWKQHLERRDILERCSDHDLAFSLYFKDPWGNMHEITTYDHEPIRAALIADSND